MKILTQINFFRRKHSHLSEYFYQKNFDNKKTILPLAFVLGALGLNSCSEEQLQEKQLQVENNQELMKSSDSDWPKIKEVGVKTKWTIGRKSKNCFKLGLCKLKEVTPYIKFETKNANVNQGSDLEDREISAFVSVSPSRDAFSFLVDEDNLGYVQYYFGSNKLILEEDYLLEPEESTDLGVEQNFILKAGEYEFIYDENYDYYEVIFTNYK